MLLAILIGLLLLRLLNEPFSDHQLTRIVDFACLDEALSDRLVVEGDKAITQRLARRVFDCKGSLHLSKSFLQELLKL